VGARGGGRAARRSECACASSRAARTGRGGRRPGGRRRRRAGGGRGPSGLRGHRPPASRSAPPGPAQGPLRGGRRGRADRRPAGTGAAGSAPARARTLDESAAGEGPPGRLGERLASSLLTGEARRAYIVRRVGLAKIYVPFADVTDTRNAPALSNDNQAQETESRCPVELPASGHS